MEKRYQIFVSSTYADLKEERQKVIQTVMELDCIPAGMELFPATDEEQWKFIQRVIDDCDYYIVIIGGRYGSLTEEGMSYTEKEYDYAIARGLKVLAFLHERPDEIPVGKSDIAPELRSKLETFREKVRTNRLVKMWSDAAELPGLVALSLSKTIKVYPAVGWVRATNVVSGELLEDLNILRKENVQLQASVSELESRASAKNTDLAPMEEAITLRLNYYESFPQGNRTREVSVSWNELFGWISPDLQKHPSDGTVDAALGVAIWRKNFAGEPQQVRVDHQDFQTIRLQLTALGLIRTNYTRTSKGGMALFWELTKRGEELMMQLRTVKSANNRS
ncbi:MAG: DUF4062 domain-containing protein [Rhodospirillales bacterium]|nr:DUF4062 domain-containing protein [Rhodospirillales bacterium]